MNRVFIWEDHTTDRFKEHKEKKYALGLVDECLARWMLESELEFSMTRRGKASSQR